jgi:tetratricopeptide (TPR) repeat protein
MGMPILSAENYFRRGLMALAEGQAAEAAGHFESAIRIEREHHVPRPQMRYLSYYGLSVTLAQRATPEAIEVCERAARMEPFNPDLRFNLGRVYLMAGKLTLALATLEKARRMAPWHKGIELELRRVDRRSSPPIAWLHRDHPVNRFCGKLRSSLLAFTPRWLLSRRTVLPS